MSNLSDEELYKIYEKLDLAGLNEELASEKNLHKKRIIRSILRSKSTEGSGTVNGIRENKIQATVCNSVSSAPQVASENESEIKHLEEQLRSIVNINERQEIRKKIRELKSQKDTNAATTTSPITKQETKSESKVTYNIVNKSEPQRSTPSENKTEITKRSTYSTHKEYVKPAETIVATKSAVEHRSPANLSDTKPLDSVESKKQIYATYRSMSREKLELKHNSESIQKKPDKAPNETIYRKPDHPTIVETKTDDVSETPSHKSYYKPTMSTDVMKEVQEKSPLFKRRTINSSQENKEDNEPKKPVNLKHAATFSVTGAHSRPEVTSNYSKEKLELQLKKEITVTEKDEVTFKAPIRKKIESKFPKSTWYFRDKKISEYPTWYFNKLQIQTPKDFKQDDAEFELNFLKCEKRNHEGTFKLEVEDSKTNWFCEFNLVIKPLPVVRQTPSRPESTNVEQKLPASSIGAAKESSNPVTRSATMYETKNIRNEASKPEVKIEQHRPEIKIEAPSAAPVVKHHKPVSRIDSMKGLFEKQEPPQVSPRTTRRSGAPNTPSKTGGMDPKELARLVTSSLYEDEGPQHRPNSNTSAVAQVPRPMDSLSTVQTGPNRRTSQTGLLGIVPKLVQKARGAKSSVESKKQTLIRFCAGNTEEYSNVDIKNLSVSWADGLAFCALIHHFFPNSFDYSKLTNADPLKNFELAFSTAKREGGIEPLIDPEDMTTLDKPDWKCVYTYLQLIYSRLKDHPKNKFKPQPPPQ